MAWIEVTSESENADPVRVFYRDQLIEKIRDNFERLDRVVVVWRRGRHWIPTPIGIALPTNLKDREQTVPEEGAKMIVDRALEFAAENAAKFLQFIGLGESKRGDSAVKLFTMQVRPDLPEDGDSDDGLNGKKAEQNAAVAAANVLNDACVNLGSMLDASHKREMLTIDKTLSMCDRQTANTSAVIWGMVMERQMKRDEHEHEEAMADKHNEHETTERFVDMFGKPFGKAFEKFLAKAFGLEDAAFNAKTFAGRLTAIVRGVGNQPDGEERLQKAKDLLGEDCWKLLQAMSKAATDEAFTELGKKFVDVLGQGPDGQRDPNAVFRQLVQILGEGPAHALLRLIDDAGLAL